MANKRIKRNYKKAIGILNYCKRVLRFTPEYKREVVIIDSYINSIRNEINIANNE